MCCCHLILPKQMPSAREIILLIPWRKVMAKVGLHSRECDADVNSFCWLKVLQTWPAQRGNCFVLFTGLVICLLSSWLARIASDLFGFFFNSVQKYTHHLWTVSLLHLLFSLPRGIRPIQKVVLSLDNCSKTNGFIYSL